MKKISTGLVALLVVMSVAVYASLSGPTDVPVGSTQTYSASLNEGSNSYESDYTTGVYENRWCGLYIFKVQGGDVINITEQTGWLACESDWTGSVDATFLQQGTYMAFAAMLESRQEWNYDTNEWEVMYSNQPIANDALIIQVSVGFPTALPPPLGLEGLV